MFFHTPFLLLSFWRFASLCSRRRERQRSFGHQLFGSCVRCLTTPGVCPPSGSRSAPVPPRVPAPLNVILSESGPIRLRISPRSRRTPALQLPSSLLKGILARGFYSLNLRSPSPNVLLPLPFPEIKLSLCTRMPATLTAMNPPACCVSLSASLSRMLSFWC